MKRAKEKIEGLGTETQKKDDKGGIEYKLLLTSFRTICTYLVVRLLQQVL